MSMYPLMHWAGDKSQIVEIVTAHWVASGNIIFNLLVFGNIKMMANGNINFYIL